MYVYVSSVFLCVFMYLLIWRVWTLHTSLHLNWSGWHPSRGCVEVLGTSWMSHPPLAWDWDPSSHVDAPCLNCMCIYMRLDACLTYFYACLCVYMRLWFVHIRFARFNAFKLTHKGHEGHAWRVWTLHALMKSLKDIQNVPSSSGSGLSSLFTCWCSL